MSKSRQEEYISLAKRKGFNVLAMDRTRAGHIKVDIESAKGVKFSTSLASTPSHKKGPNNWVQNLRRLERETLERQEANMKIILPDPSHHTQRLSEADMKAAKDLLRSMQEDLDLLLVRYEQTSGSSQWYLNRDRSTGKGNQVSRICNELLRKGLIQVTNDKQERKLIFSLTTKGGLAITEPDPKMPNLPTELFVPTPPLHGLLEQIATEVDEAESEKEVPNQDSVSLRTRDWKILEAFKLLSDEEVHKVLYFGVELLKEDIQKEAAKQLARVQPLEEFLKCLS